MSHCRRWRLVTLGLLAAVLASGCISSRAAYFRDLDRRRARAYSRWRQEDPELNRPRLDGELSIEEAVRLALLYNPELQASLKEKEVARGTLWEAYSEALPTVELTAEYGRVDVGTASFQLGERNSYSYRVRITQPLYKGGAMAIAARAARLFSYLTDEGIRASAENIILLVANSYYDAVLAQRLIEVQEAALESAREQLRSVTVRKDVGVATEYDVLRAQVEVSILQADLLEQKNRRNLARAQLLRNMGVSQRSEIELATGLSYQAVAQSLEDVVRTAFENRPDIYLAVINEDLQQEAVNEAYTHYWPRLEAFYWHQWAKPDPFDTVEVSWGRQWQAGVSMTWTLFDGLAREGRIIREKALLRQREIQLAGAEQQAVLEARSALLEMENAVEFVESQKQNLKRAQRALELVEAGYRAEVNTELEVLDARTAVTRARGLHYQALHRHTMARVALQKAMGMLGSGPGARDVPTDVAPPGDIEAALAPPGGLQDEAPAPKP